MSNSRWNPFNLIENTFRIFSWRLTLTMNVIIGPTCHFSICAYSVCCSTVLCFLLCAYNLAVCFLLLFDLECFGSIFQQANIKGVVENMTLVLVVEGIVNFTGFIKKRSCQLLFLKDARTHFQVWCIFLGWTSSNFI